VNPQVHVLVRDGDMDRGDYDPDAGRDDLRLARECLEAILAKEPDDEWARSMLKWL
jgi:hypothetical protein